MNASILDTNSPQYFAISKLEKLLTNDLQHKNLLSTLKKSITKRDVQNTATILRTALALHGPIYPLLLVQEVSIDVYKLYEANSIEDTIRDATLQDITLWAEEYSAQHGGEIGLHQTNWISRHLCCAIVQLGRLQFEPKPFNAPFVLYQKDGRTLTLAKAELCCDRFGYLCDASEKAFETVYKVGNRTILAHSIDEKKGTIAPKPQLFELDPSNQMLDSTTEVLHVHIPKRGSFSDASVSESFAQAESFFPSHLFCVCTSWLLDPALEKVADQNSNIVLFMKRFSKYPVAFEKPQIFERVFGFGFDEEMVKAYDWKTSLQKNVQQAMREGTIFRTTGGFTLTSKTRSLQI
ncbi:MAG: hypothetical protein EOM15_09530 [Spirochaetia bacterium]|nr:hypothetical protein [Spirochaetia bacterium]